MSKKGTPTRPTVMTKDVLQKLEKAFLLGLTDEMACLFAEISPSTLYNYQSKHPQYLELKESLKTNVKMRARINVARQIASGDIDTSKWYLEKRDAEFNPKHKVEVKDSRDEIDLSSMSEEELLAYGKLAGGDA